MAESKTKQFNKEVARQAVNDAFQNVAARLGAGMPNVSESSTYVLERMTNNYVIMTALYRGSWLVRKIIDTIPKDMLCHWLSFESDLEPDEIDQLHKTIRNTRLIAQLDEGMRWGRLYGGAAGLIAVDGQDNLEEPLNIDKIMPGDYKGILISDRWAGVYPGPEMVVDIASPDFGLPEYYYFSREDNLATEQLKVHHSRIIRFIGDELPIWESVQSQYWGASKVESFYKDLLRRDGVAANIAGLIYIANLRIIKMEDIGQILSSAGQQSKELFNLITAQNHLMSNFGMQIMSKDDDFQSVQLSNFSGINDVYESFMLDISGATGIPATKLFGRDPAGLNATGEGDMKNYYSLIQQEQENVLRPILDKVMPVIMMSTYGEIPDIEYEFESLEMPTQKENAELVKAKTESLMMVSDRGKYMSPRAVGLELQAISKSTGLFTNITDDEIAQLSDKIEPPPEYDLTLTDPTESLVNEPELATTETPSP